MDSRSPSLELEGGGRDLRRPVDLNPGTARTLTVCPDHLGRTYASFHPSCQPILRTVTLEAAAVAVIIAALLGWYGRMWREREGDRSVTRTRAANAKKAVWKARGVILVVGIVAAGAVYVWLHGSQ